MAFYGYKDDADKCYWTPYSCTYDYYFSPTPIQASSQYSSPYEFGKPELIEYKSSACHRDDSFVTPLELNHSVYTYSEPNILQYEPVEYSSSYNYYQYSANPSEINYSAPKLLQYEPPPHDRGYSPSETKFTISYSTAEFNDPKFEEYDPTPYGGGYDPATTYGNPLPPSDITCYPRSVPQSDSISMENFSYASIPSPYGKDDDLPTEPPNGSKPIDTKTDTEAHVKDGDKVTSDVADVEIVEPSSVIPGESKNGDKVTSDGPDVEPSSVIPTDYSPSDEHQNGFENGMRGDCGYESERQVAQIPYGSGLEAMDLCECIFGYWPCLAKRAQQQKYCEVCDHERRMDPWKSAADYLFGSPAVYDYENYHHQQQAQYECYENSWLQ
ncbi:hypothetical protein Pfo_013041 [Paulownia fortunei]|nr:hypothetical protein Pfo_013041 [Paulownia fortunei]